MDLIDSSDDEGGGYGPPIPKAAPPQPTVPIPVENKEEEKSPPSAQPATTEIVPINPEPQPSQFTMQVAKVESSSLVQGLQTGKLTPEDAQKCSDIIGYVPQNLLDKKVQRELLENGHPALQAAFKNRMLRAFVMGVNSASFTLSCGLISLEISRFLLTECVKKLGLTSVCREKLLPISKQINAQVDNLNAKRVQFVLHMAEISKNMGTVHNLLRFNASADAVVQRLETFNLDLEGQMKEIDEAADLSLAVIGEGADFIMSVLREDDGYQKQEKKVKLLEIEWRKSMQTYEETLDARKDEEYRLQAELKQLQVNKSTEETRKAYRARDLPEITRRAANHQATITRYQELRTKVEQGAEEDAKHADQIAEETKRAAMQEINDQRAGIDAQISMLKEEIRKKVHQTEDFRNRSKTASDGRERQTTYRRHGYWWRWWSSYSYKTEYVQARPNEKQRLEAMASTVENEKNELHRKIEALEAKKKDIKRTLMKQMTDESLRIKRAENETSSTIRQRRMAEIEQQIKYMERLSEVSEAERVKIEQELVDFDARIGELENEIAIAQRKLEAFQAEDNPSLLTLNATKEEEQAARQALSQAKKELHKYTEIFGTNSGEDFTSFMRIFTMLNGSVQKLPQTLQNMQAAFEVATKTFNSEVFRDDLQLLTQSGGDVGGYLMQTTDEMHAVCELAFQVVDLPGRALMAVDHSQAVEAIQASATAGAIEGPNEGGPQIEEVE